MEWGCEIWVSLYDFLMLNNIRIRTFWFRWSNRLEMIVLFNSFFFCSQTCKLVIPIPNYHILIILGFNGCLLLSIRKTSLFTSDWPHIMSWFMSHDECKSGDVCSTIITACVLFLTTYLKETSWRRVSGLFSWVGVFWGVPGPLFDPFFFKALFNGIAWNFGSFAGISSTLDVSMAGSGWENL